MTTPSTSTGRRARRDFGSVRKLPSGRFQARYRGPDGAMRSAPVTYETRGDAAKWLSVQEAAITHSTWRAPEAGEVTFGAYFGPWLAGRRLRPITRDTYAKIYRAHLEQPFGTVPLDRITAVKVREWHAQVGQYTGPTAQAHAYQLLRAVMNTAVADDAIAASPCRIRGAGAAKRARTIEPLTLQELAVVVEHTPARFQAMVVLAAWCALRFGEVTELRRKNLTLSTGVIKVRHGASFVDGAFEVGAPKTAAGVRNVTIPPHLMPIVKAHLREHVAAAPDALLFPAAQGGHLHNGTMTKWFKRAVAAADRPDVTFHQLRHFGATMAALSGATLAELMSRIGHSTPGAALIYQHATADRDKVIADALSALAMPAAVVPIGTARAPR